MTANPRLQNKDIKTEFNCQDEILVKVKACTRRDLIQNKDMWKNLEIYNLNEKI